MRMKLSPRLIPALLFVLAAFPIFSQVSPSGFQDRPPFFAGIGLSGFEPSYGSGLLLGGSLWFGYMPNRLPRILDGLGVEVAVRDLSLHRSPSQPPNLRIDEVGAGVRYSWRHFQDFRPYAKLLWGFGNIDSMGGTVRYHDTRTVTTGGGGFEYRLLRHVWARADYEYQFWPDYWQASTPAGSLNPQGFTVGAMYHFGASRSR